MSRFSHAFYRSGADMKGSIFALGALGFPKARVCALASLAPSRLGTCRPSSPRSGGFCPGPLPAGSWGSDGGAIPGAPTATRPAFACTTAGNGPLPPPASRPPFPCNSPRFPTSGQPKAFLMEFGFRGASPSGVTIAPCGDRLVRLGRVHLRFPSSHAMGSARRLHGKAPAP